MGLWYCSFLCAADGTLPAVLKTEITAEMCSMLHKLSERTEKQNKEILEEAKKSLQIAKEVQANNKELIEQNDKLVQQNEKITNIHDELITKYQESTALNAALCQKLENMLRFRKTVFKTLDFCILAGTVYCGYWYLL